MAAPALVLKAAASILANEKSRKAVGWVLIAVLSPIILLLAFFCTTFSGGAEHNRTVADLCFHGGAVPEGTPEEYQAYIQEMRDSFVLLDAAMQTVEGQMEDGDGLDDIRVKAVFFGRMIPLFRSFISLPAGVERMPVPTFVLFTALGSLIWNTAFVVAGFLLGQHWYLVEQYAGIFSKVVLAAAVLGIGYFALSRWLRQRREREAAEDLTELLPRVDDTDTPTERLPRIR